MTAESKRLRGVTEQLAGLDVVVLTQRDDDGQTVLRELQRSRAAVRHLWPIPDHLPREADVVFCDLLPGLAARLPWLPGEAAAALVLLLPVAQPTDLVALRDCAPQAVLPRPVPAAAVLPTLLLAHEQFRYEGRLRSRIDKLDDTLRTMRNVERAKSILMRARRLTEDEAFQLMRRQAMERRMTIGKVAETVIDSQSLLG